MDGHGKLLVKDVIKLEDLQRSWPVLQGQICGLSSKRFEDDADLRRNPSTHAHYSIYYDDQTRKIVEAYVAADLKAFGYTFEDQRSSNDAQTPVQPKA